MSDIVEWLRGQQGDWIGPRYEEAAAEIERLRRELQITAERGCEMQDRGDELLAVLQDAEATTRDPLLDNDEKIERIAEDIRAALAKVEGK